jgi:hypothetical protein
MPSFEWATLLAFVITGITFGITFWRTRKSEQIRIVSEFSRNLNEAENKIAEISDMPQYEDQKEIRYKQYLNQWEFFSFLVNKGEIKDKHIREYFKPSLISDYESIFARYKQLAENENEYEEFKKLYKKWKGK